MGQRSCLDLKENYNFSDTTWIRSSQLPCNKKDAKHNSWLKKKEDVPKQTKKKLNLENHDSISTKITHSKKMS